MEKLTLKSFSKKRKINKIEALEFIENDLNSVPQEVKAFLCGFDYITHKDEEGNVVRSELKPCRDPRNHKEDYLPQLEAFLIMEDNWDDLRFNENATALIQMYAISDPKRVSPNEFFRFWARLIKTSKLYDMHSMDTWFALVLEDKLTLGASFNGKCPVDLEPYKLWFK